MINSNPQGLKLVGCHNVFGHWDSYNFTFRKRKKERTVDALALGGDEGRGKLR